MRENNSDTYLASSVDNLAVVLDTLVLDHLLARGLNGRVVVVIVRRWRDKLLCEGRLACGASACIHRETA